VSEAAESEELVSSGGKIRHWSAQGQASKLVSLE